MLITENDEGRKVRLRNGKEYFIGRYYSGMPYPVILSDGSCYGADGYYNNRNTPTKIDIVEFVDGHSTVELPEGEIPQHTSFQDVIFAPVDDDMDVEFEDNGQFIQKVPSAESNAKRFLKMLEAQKIYELVVVTDIGEVRCKLNRDRQGEG